MRSTSCLCCFVGYIFLVFNLLVGVMQVSAGSSYKRKVTSELMCNGSNVHLMHVTAVGPADTIHYIFSTFGVPSVLVAHCSSNYSSVNVDCSRLANSSTAAQSVVFEPTPALVIVLLFTQLIEYDDTDNVANLSHYLANSTLNYSLANITWNNSLLDGNIIVMNASDNSSVFNSNGSLTLKFEVFGDDGHGDVLPHLAYNANISHVSIVLDRLRSMSDMSRFALEMVLVTSPNIGSSMSMSERGSIDDEYTPGSFYIVDWLSDSIGNVNGAFLSWKPICYTSPTPSVSASTQVHKYALEDYNFTLNSMFTSGLVYAYFGSVDNPVHVKSSVLSFGAASDEKFYNTTNYISWAFTIGLGAPVSEGLSLLIILVISIFLGVPFLLVIVGALYVMFRKLCSRYRGYTEISSSYSEIQ